MHMNNAPFKTLGPQAANLVAQLHEGGRATFGLDEIRKIIGLAPASARSFARKLVDRGVATRVRPGLFVLVPYELGTERNYVGNPLVLAREVMSGEDYYLSHGTAMEIHGMVTQPRLVVTVTTPKQRRSFTAWGMQFRFIYCRHWHQFGLIDHWAIKQEKVRVSDLERTVIDGLKQPGYCGGLTEVAKGLWIRSRELDVPKLVNYAERLGVGAVLRRLGFLLETYELASPDILERIQRMLTSTSTRLDPTLPAEGRHLRRWRLQLNVTPEEIKAVVRT